MDLLIFRLNSRFIRILFIVFEITWCIFVLVTFSSRWSYLWKELGEHTAQLAVFSFLLTLLPGIIKRLQLVPQTRPVFLLLNQYRRHIGIVTFLFAASHAVWSYALPQIRSSTLHFPYVISEWLGLVALTLLFFLFLTSNDFSIKFLGRYWKRLHFLVHLIIWLMLVHVLIKGGYFEAFSIGVILICDVASFLKVLFTAT